MTASYIYKSGISVFVPFRNTIANVFHRGFPFLIVTACKWIARCVLLWQVDYVCLSLPMDRPMCLLCVCLL